MKGIALAATMIVWLAAFAIAGAAQDAPVPASISKQGPAPKASSGWVLPFASQAMTDTLTPQQPTGADSATHRTKVKFDHISDNTPPHQGIAPQKTQR
jgi:hypothetical protein